MTRAKIFGVLLLPALAACEPVPSESECADFRAVFGYVKIDGMESWTKLGNVLVCVIEERDITREMAVRITHNAAPGPED